MLNYNKMKVFNKYLIAIFFSFLFFSCNSKTSIEKLPLSVKSNFAMLQQSPQFVMYLNFKSMRATNFWKDNVSDSILSAENTFGSLLNTFKTATGATITDGLDEMYYSNSWLGENAIVLKGVFDKNKVTTFLDNDTQFVKTRQPNGNTVYTTKSNNVNFFFKDNYTLCASNYLNRIDSMYNANDTAVSGLLLNNDMMNAVNGIIYKENLFMVTNEKTFIRGIFANFIESKLSKNSNEQNPFDTTEAKPDSLSATENLMMNNIYKKINSIGFSAKMRDDLNFVVQFSCIDSKSAEYLDKLFSGLISLSKLSSASKKEQLPSATEKILNSIDIKTYENQLEINIKINKDNINEFRKNTVLSKPN
jgi:hypothetical protein